MSQVDEQQAQRAFFRQSFRNIDTEELIDRQRKGQLTEIAAEVIAEVLAERGVSAEQRQEIAGTLQAQEQAEDLAPGVRASLDKRFTGQVIDFVIAVLLGAAALLLCNLTGVHPVVAGLVYLGYLLLADGLEHGQSFGKKFVRTAVVVRGTGKPCGFGRSLVRNLSLTFLGFLDIVFIFTAERRRLGDIFAGTDVINRPRGTEL